MASSGSSVDDDSFRERVKKTFGSLSFSQSSSPSNPPWSLTGDEIEKREWRREHDSQTRDSNPCSTSLNEFFSRNKSRRSLGSLSNELEYAAEEEGNRSGVDEWQIRSSIGLDNTLDNEEEEDINDIVAIGRDNSGDRLYMADVKESDDHSRASASTITCKDPRANRLAAITRLKEDAAAGATIAMDETSNDNAAAAGATIPTDETSNDTEQHLIPTDSSTAASTISNVVKPILKRKGVDTDSSSPKPAKRVRFQSGCKVDVCPPSMVDEEPTYGVETTTIENGLLLSNENKATKKSSVPDYLLNPSKYKRYSLDSIDEEGKITPVKSSSARELELGVGNEVDHTDTCRAVVFIPKKRSKTVSSETPAPSKEKDDNGEVYSVTHSSSCSREQLEEQHEVENSGIGMEIDEPEVGEIGDKMSINFKNPDEPDVGEIGNKLSINFKKPGRQYRARCGLDE